VCEPGRRVSAGSATINQSGSAVTIDQTSARVAISWQSFNIGAGESETFNQPSTQAIALNRILGQDPSLIQGSLTANGQVFLLNPNGVLFGAGAQVDVGGIVASTLDLSNDDFLAGRYTFTASDGNTGSVLNEGTSARPTALSRLPDRTSQRGRDPRASARSRSVPAIKSR
jgi:filamentous hemagglutinin family protein